MNYSSENVPQNTTYVRTRGTFSILQTFKIDKSTLENVVKILYDSELDNGLFGERYSIINVSCSGTIYGNFYFLPYTSIENLTTFLLNLYASLYSSKYNKDGSEYMSKKILELSSDITGSISKPFEVLKNIEEHKIFNTDFIKLIFNLKNESLIKDDMKDINNLIVNEKGLSLSNDFESFESIDRILKMRLKFTAEDAAMNEFNVDRDELYEIARETRYTGEEDLHLIIERLRNEKKMKELQGEIFYEGPNLRERKSNTNYKETKTYRRKDKGSGVHRRFFGKYLNIYARNERRNKILIGRSDFKTIKTLDNLHNIIIKNINEFKR